MGKLNSGYKCDGDQNIILSFCIATYKRYDVLMELVREILSYESDDIEVIVSDNDAEGSEKNRFISEIDDKRLHYYVNEKNIGALGNMWAAWERGNGEYLLYLNDRDNIDRVKIRALIEILKELYCKNVAFAYCSRNLSCDERYTIFEKGEKAFVEFTGKVIHPSGYIFRRKAWRGIISREDIFINEAYGFFPFTLLSGMMAKYYNGAIINGDICDVLRERIDFTSVKSGFYQGKKERELWYSAERQWKELKIAERFSRTNKAYLAWKNNLLINRYEIYLHRVIIDYEEIIRRPSNSIHYGKVYSDNYFSIVVKEVLNGIYLWRRTRGMALSDKALLKEIDSITRRKYEELFDKVMLNILENAKNR